jgi:transglutaminase-like putative cysteine protease
LASSLGWFLVAFALALVLFFFVPRTGQDSAAALVFRSQVQPVTGFNPGMDLNNVGPLQVNEDLVMRVEARDAADQPLNLGPDVRFRGVTCSQYNEGRWQPRQINDVRPVVSVAGPPPGANAATLTYHIDFTKLAGGGREVRGAEELRTTPVFLVEPPYTPNGRPSIRIDYRRDAQKGFDYRDIEPTLLAPLGYRSRAVRYTQFSVLPPATQTKWVQPVERQRYVSTYLLSHPAYLRTLPPRLAQSGLLDREAKSILQAAKLPAAASEEQKARALEAHLANSGLFEYALEWQRRDRSLDPTEDFLLNVKKGHCELFASALALMLRSQGIPARVVIGFRGAEWNSLTEQMEVRQYHAHAWVEALVDQRDQRFGAPFADWHWLTLDPTPAGGTAGAVGAENLRGAWDDEIHFLQFLWESFILDYSGEGEREQLLARLGRFQWLRSTWEFWSDVASVNQTLTVFLGGGFLLLVVWAIFRRLRGRRKATTQRISVAFYARLLKLLERLPLRPARSQTPAEFGRQAAQSLAERLPAAEAAPLAQLPLRIIAFFYAVRFGGRTLQPEQIRDIDQDLDRLAKALQT